MSHLNLAARVSVTRLLVQHGIAPSVDGARVKEVLASFELDRKLLFRNLKALSVSTYDKMGEYSLLSHWDWSKS